MSLGGSSAAAKARVVSGPSVKCVAAHRTLTALIQIKTPLDSFTVCVRVCVCVCVRVCVSAHVVCACMHCVCVRVCVH